MAAEILGETMSTRNNPIQAAIDWYLEVVDKAIQDIRSPKGIQQQCDFTILVEMVRTAPKHAQVLIQQMSHALKEGEVGNNELHGTWITMAYLCCFGESDESHRFLNRYAPDLYQAARKQLDDNLGGKSEAPKAAGKGKKPWWKFWG